MYCFHRNKIKETNRQPFDIYKSTKNQASQNILNKLRTSRKRLLEFIYTPKSDHNNINELFNEYCTYIYGFIFSPEDPETSSKLSGIFTFRWSNSLDPKSPTSLNCCAFEFAQMTVNVSLWCSNSAEILTRPLDLHSPACDDALKSAFKLFRWAAGLLVLAKQITPRVSSDCVVCDSQTPVIDMYFHQALAQAQEIVVERAIRLKHDPGLIASLSYLTSQHYDRCTNIGSPLLTKSDRLRKYYSWKCNLYSALAYSFHTIELLAMEKPGEAKCANSFTEKKFNVALKEAELKEWRTFSLRFDSTIQRHVQRCNMERSMLYPRSVSVENIPEPGPPQSGAVEAEQVNFPDISSVWTTSAYEGFLVP